MVDKSKIRTYTEIIVALHELKIAMTREVPMPSFMFVIESKMRAYKRRLDREKRNKAERTAPIERLDTLRHV